MINANIRRILFNLIDIVYVASILSIPLILITGGIKIKSLGFGLTSLERPIIFLMASIIIKKVVFRDILESTIVTFINKYSLRKIKFYIFLVSLVFFIFISSKIVIKDLPGGDETHFLMITSSIVKDGDINLRNNHDNGDFYEFYPGPLAPHARILDDNRIYSAHGVGLPLLIAPGYLLGNRYGATLIINVLSALLAVVIFSLSLIVTNNRVLSTGLGFLISFTVPLVFYSFQIYAELPGALIVSYLFLEVSLLNEKQHVSLFKKILIGLLLAYLPWLHVRFIIFVILVSLYLWQKIGFRKILPVLGIVLLSICLILVYMRILYGGFSIFAQYSNIDSGIKYTFRGLLGNMIDARFGLFLYSPYYIFLGAGLYFLYLKDKRLFFWWSLFTVPFVILVSSFYHWHGGCCPPLRYIVPIIPLFVVPIGCLLSIYRSYLFYILFAILAYISFMIKKILSENTLLMINYEYLDSRILNYFKLRGLDLYCLFPIVTENSLKTFMLISSWAICIVFLTYAIIKDYKDRKSNVCQSA